MTYFLKTSPFCYINCGYCEQLGKKSNKYKTLIDIEKELKKAGELGFDSVRLSCNTDLREDFPEILQLIKGRGFKVILETTGRAFYAMALLKKISGFIDKYEVYLNYPNLEVYIGNSYCRGDDIGGAAANYHNSIKGIGNISKFYNKKKGVVAAKIVLMGDNLPFLTTVIDKIKKIGLRQIKFVQPFKLRSDDCVLSLSEVVPNIAAIKHYARRAGIKVSTDSDLEYNPYLPRDLDFFNIKKAELKINFRRYNNKPKFSVIIPAFNKKGSLKFVLANFFNQDYPKSKYEIIVVDDGSNDKTLESIKEIKPSCNFKYFYWPRKKTKLSDSARKWAKFYNRAGLARNIGIKNAEGEIILFNDADILPTKDCLRKHGQYHGRYSNIITRGFRMFLPQTFSPGPKMTADFNYLDKISYPEKTERGKRLHCRMHDLSREGWQRTITANLSIKKKYLDEIGGFGRDFIFWGFEDVDLGYRLSKLKMKLIWDEKIKVYHLHHPRESGNELKTLLAFWAGTNILYRKYLDEEIYNIFVDVILRRLDNLMLS